MTGLRLVRGPASSDQMRWNVTEGDSPSAVCLQGQVHDVGLYPVTGRNAFWVQGGGETATLVGCDGVDREGLDLLAFSQISLFARPKLHRHLGVGDRLTTLDNASADQNGIRARNDG